MKEYFLFPIYPKPLRRVINFIREDIVIDIKGNIYKVDNMLEPELIIKSPFRDKKSTLTGSNEAQRKLFTNIANTYIDRFIEGIPDMEEE